MLSNKTRNNIKRHFKKTKSTQKIYEEHHKDFTEKGQEEELETVLSTMQETRYSDFNKIDNPRYIGDEHLDLSEKLVKGVIHIVIYGVNTQLFKPFLIFCLEKKDEELHFPMIKIEKHTKVSLLHSNIQSIYQKITGELDYQGLYNINDKVYLFYKMDDNLDDGPLYVTNNAKFFFAGIHEIVNMKKVYQIKIHTELNRFFLKNQHFCYLEDEDFNIIETPMVGYTGSYYKRIAIIAGLGPIRGSPFAAMGPYFYFSNFKRAMRYGVITVDGKPKEVNGVKITIGDSPVYEKGGIVKFIIFVGAEKVFLNRDNDADDTSEISKDVASKSDIVNATIKNRDNDGNWVKDNDSTIITFKTIKFKGEMRDLEPQYTIRKTSQVLPVSYYYLDTQLVYNGEKIGTDNNMFDHMKAKII